MPSLRVETWDFSRQPGRATQPGAIWALGQEGLEGPLGVPLSGEEGKEVLMA